MSASRFLLISLFAFMFMVLGMASPRVQSYAPKPGETVMVVDIASRGKVFIKLFTKEAPQATNQIMRLARSGFYNGLRFHRVAKSPRPYLVQVGDPGSKDGSKLDDSSMGTGGSGTKVPFENTGYSHVAGAVGLSTPQNDKNGGDSQFHIMLGAYPFLDGNYTVFGQVVAGMDVVGKIEKGDVISSVSIISG